MKIALIQTKQNKLYNFVDQTYQFTVEEAKQLQKEMIDQNLILLQEAISQQCDFIVTTEAINFPGQINKINGNYRELVPEKDNAMITALQAIAKQGKTYIVAGIYYQKESKIYNAALVYDRNGSEIGCYHKIHLAGDENNYLTPGERFHTIETDFGRIGICICYDMQFPETARELSLQGADLIVCPTWGWEQIYAHARAYENGVYVASAMAIPYWMEIKDLRNPSEVVNPYGAVLATGSKNEAGIIYCEMDITDCRDIRKIRLSERRPECYLTSQN